ncbi:carboxypeptidase M32 [Pelagirhabdus alkalitolerans]|nr:carboxypeptidase M32 [Pelagirhabdus alkalitolerans]
MKEINGYEEALGLIQWDLRTKIPTEGAAYRSDVVGLLSEKIYSLKTSDELKEVIDNVQISTEDPILKQSAKELDREYLKYTKIPSEDYKAFVTLQSQSESIWQQAKETSDFSLLKPYLEDLIAYNRKFARIWGYDNHPYDALLNQYEPGLTTEILDPIFDRLKQALKDLLKRTQKSEVEVDTEMLLHHFPKEDQRAFGELVLEKMGYNFNAGRLDETIHPFAIGINPKDVRVTTRFVENDFRVGLFGTIHEGGHALYEQNFDEDLYETVLKSGASMGVHESQSLFWENMIGRSHAFWESHFDQFRKVAPAAFQTIEFDAFYKAINEVKSSYIRIEADELTYCLHIILRYELEKDLINHDLEVKDLPEAWNEKMHTLLGITPSNDAEGVLQDIHWAAGEFGYFPTYALGYMYAAQLHVAMQRDLDVESIVRMGDFEPIKAWLTEHVHRHGKMKEPLKLIEEISNETFNPDYLINYLTSKYTHLYDC